MPSVVIDDVQNFSKGTLVGTYNASATTLNLSTGDGLRFPQSTAFQVVVWNETTYPDPCDDPNREIMRVTAVNVDQLTVVRGQEIAKGGLAASPKDTPGVVYRIAQCLTAKMIQDIQSAAVDVGALTIYVSEKGAKGDGATDDTAAINSALTDGNYIIFPPGTYIVSAALILKSNLLIKGAGVGVTTIKLKNNAGAVSMFTGTSIARFTIKDLTIDANESNNVSALDVFDIDGLNRGDFENIEISNVRKRAISLGDSSGAVTRVRIRNCTIDTCRDHCIEIDNRGSTNLGVFVSNCILSVPGASGGSAKAGIAAFGRVQVSNVYVDGVADNNYGVWLRADDGTLGAGAHESNVANVEVFGSRHATNISIGFKLEASRCTLTGCHADTCDYGFQVVGDNNALIGCKGTTADTVVRLEGDKNKVIDGFFETTGSGNTVVDVRSGSDDNIVRNNKISALSSATKVTVSGANLHAGNNDGWKTSNRFVSSTVDVTGGTGTKTTGNVAHGLDVTPTVDNFIVAFVVGNGDTAVRAGTLRIASCDGTNAVADFATTTAGGASATLKVGFDVNVYP